MFKINLPPPEEWDKICKRIQTIFHPLQQYTELYTILQSYKVETPKQELIDLYLQGYYDRDWKISEDEAFNKAEKYANQIIKKHYE